MTTDLTHDAHTQRLQARLTRLEARLARLRREQTRHGASFIPEGELGGIRTMSAKRKAQRLERVIDQALEATRLTRELAAARERLRAYLAGEINAQGRKPGKARKPVLRPHGPDHPRKIEQGLSLDGRFTLSDGSLLRVCYGEAAGELVGWVTLRRPDGSVSLRLSPSSQGNAMYETAIALAGAHLAGAEIQSDPRPPVAALPGCACGGCDP